MKYALLIMATLLGAMQLIRFEMSNPASDPRNEIRATAPVMAILRQSCYDCHSNQTRWPWYSHIAPISWTIAEHVNDGRKWVNFSEWNGYDEAHRTKLSKEIARASVVAMPLASYTWAHPATELSDAQRRIVMDYFGGEGYQPSPVSKSLSSPQSPLAPPSSKNDAPPVLPPD